ncbi:hypothetical protein [Cryobacterium sp. Y57]|uniref:DUF7341 domain-containing protein n=1 Tax=Cryobacterium sp. Y57 TaxID=2048287 RepID=UPI000CE4665F|nr:hypothetical protein [Cryobacterium sp. Y57]
MNDLLDALDALTKSRTTKTVQEKNGITCVSPVELPSLLDRLEDAIRGTVGIGGGGSLPNERNMLNAGNLYTAVMITTMVKEWARGAGIVTRPADMPAPLLRSWYVIFSQTERYREDHSFYLRKMQGWAKQIEALFDPPRTRDLPDDCPLCGAGTWWKDGNEYQRPLLLTFHDGPEMIETGKGECRACEAVFGIRELSYAIDAQEA